MIPILNIAIKAIRKSGNFIIQNFEKINKNYKYEYINKIYYLVEKEIIKIILKFYPHHSIFSRNIKKNLNQNNEIKWIIEPINGIINYIKGIPQFSTAIAIMIKNKIEATVIYDCINNELFSAVKGKRAKINNYRSRISKNNNMQDYIILCSNILHNNKSKIIPIINKLLNKNVSLFSTGSNLLDLAYLSTGKIDICIKVGLDYWELAIGELLVRESGGIITDIDGSENYLKTGNIIAGNVNLVKNILINIQDI